MTEFYKAYLIVAAVPQQLSWSHIRELIPIDSEEERRFYEVQAIKNTWSLYKLREQIKTKVYQQAKKEGQIITKLPLQLPEPEEVFKDTYHFDFLALKVYRDQRELFFPLTTIKIPRWGYKNSHWYPLVKRITNVLRSSLR
jgi:hypothetical protein